MRIALAMARISRQQSPDRATYRSNRLQPAPSGTCRQPARAMARKPIVFASSGIRLHPRQMLSEWLACLTNFAKRSASSVLCVRFQLVGLLEAVAEIAGELSPHCGCRPAIHHAVSRRAGSGASSSPSTAFGSSLPLGNLFQRGERRAADGGDRLSKPFAVAFASPISMRA